MSAVFSKLFVINPRCLKKTVSMFYGNGKRLLGISPTKKTQTMCRGNATKCPPCSEKSGQSTKGDYIRDKCDVFDIPHGNSRPYRILSYFMFPIIIALAINVFSVPHEEPELEYVPYEYMYRRLKRYAWGDGQKTFFHGPNNILPNEETYKPELKRNSEEENLKKRRELREQHAREELERRRARHEGRT